LGKMGGADQAYLLAGPECKNDASAEGRRVSSALRGQGCSEFEHGGGARGIVVRARVNLVLLAFPSHRPAFTDPKVIVVRADERVLRVGRIFSRRQHGENVSVGLLQMLHRSGEPEAYLRQGETGLGVRVFRVKGGLE